MWQQRRNDFSPRYGFPVDLFEEGVAFYFGEASVSESSKWLGQQGLRLSPGDGK